MQAGLGLTVARGRVPMYWPTVTLPICSAKFRAVQAGFQAEGATKRIPDIDPCSNGIRAQSSSRCRVGVSSITSYTTMPKNDLAVRKNR